MIINKNTIITPKVDHDHSSKDLFKNFTYENQIIKIPLVYPDIN